MSASSVTGRGPGSALKMGQRGPEDEFIGVEKLIGPRVVFVSSVALVGGTFNVVFPQPLVGLNTDYLVFCGGSASYAYASAFTTSGFTITGSGTQVVNYVVIKINSASVLPPDYPYA